MVCTAERKGLVLCRGVLDMGRGVLRIALPGRKGSECQILDKGQALVSAKGPEMEIKGLGAAQGQSFGS